MNDNKIKEYKVICGVLGVVVEEVNNHIQIGWEPIGNIATLDGHIFHQAIILKN
jgi:hypothetical protein